MLAKLICKQKSSYTKGSHRWDLLIQPYPTRMTKPANQLRYEYQLLNQSKTKQLLKKHQCFSDIHSYNLEMDATLKEMKEQN